MNDNFEQARTLFLDGVHAFEAGQFATAERCFAAALERVPGRASTLVNLGATRIELGQPEAALQALEAAIEAEPASLDAWCHRGVALAELGRHAQALESYERALAIDARHPAAHYQRARTLTALHRHSDALAAWEQLLAARGESAETWLQHGLSLQRLGRHDRAQVSYEKAVALEPTFARAWNLLGGVLKDARRPQEAARCFEQAARHGGGDEVNRYLLASLRAAAVPASAPRAYVESLFDDYAQHYDDHLLGELNYRAYEVLVGYLTAERARFGAALDIGCGTGLIGPLLMPFVSYLDGVDLSARMLEMAGARQAYRRLTHCDIGDFLATTEERYDLVLACDVFIYLGQLDAVFSGVRRVLNAGGVFAFTVERAADGVDFELRPSSRYAHSERYLRDLARRQGMRVARLEAGTLREDQREPIHGLYVVLAA